MKIGSITDLPCSKSRSVLDRARDTLRSILLTRDVGTYLGSETDVARAIGVSLPTLRQIARVLEQEQLLEMRRGPQGGIYVRRPSLDIVVETASLFLYFENSTIRDLLVTSSILSSEAARFSAAAPLDLRQELFGDLLERSLSKVPQSIEDFRRDEWLMMESLAKACSNKALSLFLHTTQHISRIRLVEWLVIDESTLESHKQLRSRIIDAILIGDGDAAHMLNRRHLPLILEYISNSKLDTKVIVR
jgi:GntR family transcriptional regulator, transcriptional repressor for pyruvate dehydrogenase complex